MKRLLLFALLLPFFAPAQVSEASRKLFADHLGNTRRILNKYQCESALIRLNRDAFTKKNWEAVIAKCNECLAIGPSAVTFEIRGRALRQKGDLPGALADLDRAVVLGGAELDSMKITSQTFSGLFDTAVLESRSYLKTLYLHRSDLHLTLGDRKAGEADVRLALKLLPNDWEAGQRLRELDTRMEQKQKEFRLQFPRTATDYVLLGNDLALVGKHPEALAAFANALTLDPGGVKALTGRGEVYLRTENYPLALAEFSRAIALSPKEVEAWTGRGWVHQRQKSWDAAIADFSKAIQLGQPAPALLNARGNAYLGKGLLDAAMKDFTRALQSSATEDRKYDRITALTGQGDVYRLTAKTDDALKAYQSAIDAGKNDYFASFSLVDTYLGRGRLYESRNQNDKAAADFRKVLEVEQQNAEARAALARLTPAKPEPLTWEQWALQGRDQFQKKDYEGAIRSFTEAARLNPNNGLLFALRGGALISKGDRSAYRLDFEKAVMLSPNDPNVHFVRGSFHQNIGLRHEAIGDFRKVLQLQPDHKAAQEKLKELGAQ